MILADLVGQIARRDSARSEATLQADIRQVVLEAPFNLVSTDVVSADLESPVGTRRRIDIEGGSCLIEVKRDLTAGTVLPDAIAQLAGYLIARQSQTGSRYVGILTNGSDWRCIKLPAAVDVQPPQEVTTFTLSPTKPDANTFLIWPEGVIATARNIPATQRRVDRRLGDGSSEHALDRQTLSDPCPVIANIRP